MREIKFQIYWVAGHEMLYDTNNDLEFRDKENYWITDLSDAINHPESYKARQYTGLKDKNGIEIYEGDIDQAENGDKSVIVFLLKAGTYCVMPMDIYINNDYQNESFFPDFIYGFGYDLFFDNCTPDKYLNIIGNRFENPELLEGNQ